MKVLTAPSSGRTRDTVAYVGRYGQVFRTLVQPRNPRTPLQQYMRGVFGGYAQMWGRKLSQQQRDSWNEEGPNVWSHPRCGTRGKLTGEQFFTGINSVLGCVNLPPLLLPPARVVFQLSVVRELVITNDEGSVRLFLRLAAPPTEDIMVFGQEPCSAGRSKRRNVSYLGLLPPSEDGMSEITDLYKARYGEPRPGRKVFIVTCQQKNGWKGIEQETSKIVPNPPEGQEAPAKPGNRQEPLMHKGCTRGADRATTPGVSQSLEGTETGTGGRIPAEAPSGGGGDGKT